MTLKCGKLTLDKQTVRSLRARSSIRAGFGNPTDPDGTTSGFNKCMEPPDTDPIAAPAAKGSGGMRTPPGETLHNGGKLPI